MADPFDEIKRLPPIERIKKLKELEDKNKKEIETAKELLKTSESELEEEEDSKRAQIEVPGFRKAGPKSFFEEDDLEKIAEGAPKLPEDQEMHQKEYFQSKPMKVLYETITGIYHEVKAQDRDMTREEKAAAYEISKEMMRREQMIEAGEYKVTGASIIEMLDIGKNILKSLYKR